MRNPNHMTHAKDLTKEPPRSPRLRFGGYSILARMIDKGRAELHGTAGEYHYNCGLDQMLFGFKGVDQEEVKKVLASGATDEEILRWFNSHGTPKSADEITGWSDTFEHNRPYDNPEKREWFEEACTPLGIDPRTSTLSEYLETDDRVTFRQTA
jgi:hypothetical protein